MDKEGWLFQFWDSDYDLVIRSSSADWSKIIMLHEWCDEGPTARVLVCVVAINALAK